MIIRDKLYFFRRIIILPVLTALTAAVLPGCSRGADTNQPLEVVEKKAQEMSVSQLQKSVKTHEKAMEKQKTELEKLKHQAKRISPAEIFGQKGNEIKKRLVEIRDEIAQLSARRDIYQKRLEHTGS